MDQGAGSAVPAAGADERLAAAVATLSRSGDAAEILDRAVTACCELVGAPQGHHDDGSDTDQDTALHHPLALRQPLSLRGTSYGVLVLAARTDGRPYDDRDRARVAALAHVAALSLSNVRAAELGERRRRWLELLARLSELVAPPIALDEALQRIADAVRTAAAATTGLAVEVPDDGLPSAVATSGPGLELEAKLRDGFHRAVRDAVQQSEVVELALDDERHVLLAPLRAHLTTPYVLALARPQRSRADEDEERRLLSTVADQAGLALDRTQALEDREAMAVVADRDRIARDLHDVVIQRLFAAGLQMQSIRAAATTPELKERIDQSARDLDQTIRDIRGTIFDLQARPQASLRSELRDLVRDYVPVLGFAPSVQSFGPVDVVLDETVHQQFVGVLREALSNVARHSGARSASVEVTVDGSRLELVVTDDGRGLPANRRDNGLRAARRRAVGLGGSLTLSGGDGGGTRLAWSVPLIGRPAGS